jgi:hypothetical protein
MAVNLLTASMARELAGPDFEDYLETINEHITKAATDKKFEVIIRQAPFRDWLYKESDLQGEGRKAVAALRQAGYKVELFYQENQFVDIGLCIKW